MDPPTAVLSDPHPPDQAGPPSASAAARGQVEVRGLSWRPYGRRERVLVDLDLDIPPGQRVLLVGPSGSGKSTLLRALAGLLETADSGERSGTVRVGGHDPQSRPGLVGLVLQEPGAGLVAATIARDVAFGPENVRMPRADMHVLVPSLLGDVGLTMPPDTPTAALSGGETQRLALSGSLALAPELLLLDEALAMLDSDTAEQVRDVVLEVVAERGLTLVVVEHRLPAWARYLDRLIALDPTGRVIADGPLEEMLEEHVEELTAAGIWVPGVEPPRPVRLAPGVIRGGTPRPLPAQAQPDGTAPEADDSPPSVGRAPATSRQVVLETGGLTISRGVSSSVGELPPRSVAVVPPLALVAGEFTALVGPSGSGKSTALLALGGLIDRGDRITVSGTVLRPSASADAAGVGSIEGNLSAQDAGGGRRGAIETGDADPRAVGWVPQWASAGLVAPTVVEEVTLTARLLGDTDDLDARATTLLDVLGLAHLATADPRQISGGEQRRVALAAATLHRPDLLLLDEPTIGQDRHTWAAVVGLLVAARAAGTSVLAATHDLSFHDGADHVVGLVTPPRPPAAASRRPLAARCGPLSLMAASAAGVALGMLAAGWRNQLVVLALVVASCLVLQWGPGDGTPPRGRIRRVSTRLLPGLLGAAMVAWSVWLLGSHDVVAAVGAALRVVLLIVPSAFLLGYLDPDALGDHLAQRLRFPARPVLAVDAALMRVASFGAAMRDIRRARKVRGLNQQRGLRARFSAVSAVSLGLLVRTLSTAATLALAMDARGFAGARRRTWYQPAPWRLADSLLLLLVGCWLALAVRLDLSV